MAGKAPLQRVDLLMHGAGVADDAPRPVEHPLAFRGEALEARAALHQQNPEGILELLDAADSVGWLTPQASAAWPKCRSRASAMMNSSFSIMAYGPQPGPLSWQEEAASAISKREGRDVRIVTACTGAAGRHEAARGEAIIAVIDRSPRASRNVSSCDGARRGTIPGQIRLRHSGSRPSAGESTASMRASLSASSVAHAQRATILLCSFHIMQGNPRI